jgi:hypothetical protein
MSHIQHLPPEPAPVSMGRIPWYRRPGFLLFMVLVVALAMIGVTSLLVSIFEHRQAARKPTFRVVDVSEVTTDPAPWGLN